MAVLVAALAAVVPMAGSALASGVTTAGLLPPLLPTTAPPPPPTTAPPVTEPPTTEPPVTEPPATDPAVPVGDGPTGDGPTGDPGCSGYCPGNAVPADAQAVLDGIARSAPNNNMILVDGERALLEAGVEPDQAARLAYGSFPVAGPATWIDDWYEPRWTTGSFRHHQGLDLIAPAGTPLRAPVDGVVKLDDGALGGIAVKVVQPDGTFYYLAHMSRIAEGLVEGQSVVVGDLVGYVGATGDASGPHLHLGIYQGGSTPIPPKPLVDLWVGLAASRLPSLLTTNQPSSTPRALLATSLVRQLGADSDGVRSAAGTDRLLAAATNPTAGALQAAEAAAATAARTVDWRQQAVVATSNSG